MPFISTVETEKNIVLMMGSKVIEALGNFFSYMPVLAVGRKSLFLYILTEEIFIALVLVCLLVVLVSIKDRLKDYNSLLRRKVLYIHKAIKSLRSEQARISTSISNNGADNIEDI